MDFLGDAPMLPLPFVASRVLLIRRRKSRIYFLRKFFDYPLKLGADTLRKLGLVRTFKIGLSYLKSAARGVPVRL